MLAVEIATAVVLKIQGLRACELFGKDAVIDFWYHVNRSRGHQG